MQSQCRHNHAETKVTQILRRWSDPPALGHRSPVLTGGNELPVTHCSLSFLPSLTIVYCRIKKLSTDNSSETLTQALSNLESGQSTVMNINRYGRTYGNGILVTKFRVRYVKITSTQRNTGRPHLVHMIASCVLASRDLCFDVHPPDQDVNILGDV